MKPGFRACENQETALLFPVPAKEHVKKPNSPTNIRHSRVTNTRHSRVTNIRHSRESGNLSQRSHKEKQADIADDRLRIPAFERVKKSNSLTNTRHSRITNIRHSRVTNTRHSRVTNTRHSRESGNLSQRSHKEKQADIADGRLRIPAFERVKKSNSLTSTRHSRESGNLSRRSHK